MQRPAPRFWAIPSIAADQVATMGALRSGGGCGGVSGSNSAQPLAAERLESMQAAVGGACSDNGASPYLTPPVRHGIRVSCADPAGHHGGGE
jgi:hypothetical protein